MNPSTEPVPSPDALGVRLADVEYALLARHGRTRRVAAGTVLFRCGEPCRAMFVIARGEIEIEAADEHRFERLVAGDAACEFALLCGELPCPATGTAVGDGTLIELDARDLDRLVDDDAATLSRFLHRAAARAVRREHARAQRLRHHNDALQRALEQAQAASERLDRAEELIRTDELTGLPNRRGLERHIAERREARALDGVGLLLIDCDRFRAINAAYGHGAGDRLLQAVAHLLTSVARTDDFACRLGDDGFCLLVATPGREALMEQAECLLATVRGLLQVPHSPPLACALSIGACVVDDGDWRGANLRATEALARAKRRGGDRVEWADATC